MAATRKDFVFFERLQVRWSEVDAQAVVFNANYLSYVDAAFTGYWRAMGLPWVQAMAALEGDVFLRQVTLDFQAPARIDDWLDIGLRCTGIGRSSITMQGAVFCGDRLLLTGTLVYVYVGAQSRTPQAVPKALRAVINAFEARQAVLRTRVGAWSELQLPARAVREAVFVQEQGIAREDEWDEADRGAVHAVAFNGLDQPVATGRLLRDAADAVAHVGRVAVLQGLRGGGHGATIMAALEQAARERGVQILQLNAQLSAAAFYRRLGYVAEGQPFDEVGIAHISMRKVLTRD